MSAEVISSSSQLTRVSGGRAWMQHAPLTGPYNEAARLAVAGKGGTSVYVHVVD